MALRAERLGFGAFFRSDHYLAFGTDGLPGPTDAWTTLAGLARDTTTIRLGTLMTSATFRHPGPLAIQVAGVDQMSGGRVELGIGAGWYDAEHSAYGIRFPTTRERFDILEEQLAVVTGLWSTPGSFSFEGEHYRVVDSPGLPKPVQEKPPASSSVAAAPSGRRRWRPRYADEFNLPFVPFEEGLPQNDRCAGRASRVAATRDCGLSSAPCSASGGRGGVPPRAEAIGQDPVDPCGGTRRAARSAEVVDTDRIAAPGRRRPGSTSRRWTWVTSTT